MNYIKSLDLQLWLKIILTFLVLIFDKSQHTTVWSFAVTRISLHPTGIGSMDTRSLVAHLDSLQQKMKVNCRVLCVQKNLDDESNADTNINNGPTFRTNTAKDDHCQHPTEQTRIMETLLPLLDQTFTYSGRLVGGSKINDRDPTYRCGFVSILGAPNVGKSSLMNALLQENLCATTSRPQTTRHAILGLLSSNATQVCLVDTPGIIEYPAYKLQEGMMEAVMGAFHDADVLLIVTDLFSTPIPDDRLFQKVQASRKPKIVCINKIDLARQMTNHQTGHIRILNTASDTDTDTTTISSTKNTRTVEDAIFYWRKLIPDAFVILPVSAVTASISSTSSESAQKQDPGVVALRRILLGGPDIPAALRDLDRPISREMLGPEMDGPFVTDAQAQTLLPFSPPLYDPETLTDRTERFIASEIIRSTLFESLSKELPYCCEVRIQSFQEPTTVGNVDAEVEDPPPTTISTVADSTMILNNNDSNEKKMMKKNPKPMIRIEADVIVERNSQKVIVIGKRGDLIKRIGILARKKLEDFFQIQVYLKLNVKVSKDWRKSDEKLRDFGYSQ